MIAVSIAGFARPRWRMPLRGVLPCRFLPVRMVCFFSAWQILFLTQSLLIVTGRNGLHRRLGLFGVSLYFVMIPLGFATTVAMGLRGFDLSGDLKVLPYASPGFVDPIAGLLFRKPEEPASLILKDEVRRVYHAGQTGLGAAHCIHSFFRGGVRWHGIAFSLRYWR